MYRIVPPLFALLSVLLSGCGRSDSSRDSIQALDSVPVLSVPGRLLLPDSSGFVEMNEADHSAILLYCWIPIGEYSDSQLDLQVLANLADRDITPVPVQFDPDVRNASQIQLNDLEIPISVAMGDDSLREFLQIDRLPVAALVERGGVVTRAYGFGCVERAVRSSR